MSNQINTAKLRGKRAEKGISYMEAGEKINCTGKTYENKEKGITEFTRKEILELIRFYNLTSVEVYEIFFASELTKVLN